MQIARGLSVIGALALAIVASGCSAADSGDENLGSIEQHFTASQCATASPVATFTSRWSYTSTTTYGTSCNALDVTALNNANNTNDVTYTGTLPTNATDCGNTYLRAVLYDDSAGSWVVDSDLSNFGVWSGSSCSVAPIHFGRLAPALPYRIAATARTVSGSSFTARQFQVFTTVIH